MLKDALIQKGLRLKRIVFRTPGSFALLKDALIQKGLRLLTPPIFLFAYPTDVELKDALIQKGLRLLFFLNSSEHPQLPC